MKKITPLKYVALLRGINVGGHHKLPMADLKKEMSKLGFENPVTLLNSGNVIFEANAEAIPAMETRLAAQLQKTFGFTVPVLIRTGTDFSEMLKMQPFKKIQITPDIRLYVSFLKQEPTQKLKLPWTSDDQTFRILHIQHRTIFSVLDLAVTKTVKGMDSLEKMFGKEITTRNWNTVEKIAAIVEK